MKVTGSVFFHTISIRNKELIPDKGPLMVLANHPSTFMDPIVIATMLNRKVYFLAKGELFNSGLAKWILPKLNMIPVYRKQDDPSQMSKNEETFNKCYEHLENGGAILMFPEGTSITERKLRPLKTGAARIVLGAEAKNKFKLNAKVIIIGLNYANPHKFNRDLFMNVDTPITVSDYKEMYTKDSFKGADALTEDIRLKLEKLIIAINDQHVDELITNIEMLYKQKISTEIGISTKDKEAEFELMKNMVAMVNHYVENDPVRVEKMRSRITEYLYNLNQLGLNDEDLEQNKQNKSLVGGSVKSFFTIILGFPVYIYGLINNYLPFEIPGLLANKITKVIEYKGAIGMVLGMFTFFIFYTLQILFVWKFTHQFWILLIYAISLPLTGMFTYWYFHTVEEIRAKWILMKVFYKKSTLISGLITERQHIILEFDKARDEYLKQ
jgi:1-acyl-sn-glycerol-3-phosphate acyltransferase